MDLETRQEQIEQAEADVEQIESQRQELEGSQGELDRLKQELERKTQELEGAWAHLNGEIRRFEERQADGQQQAGLDGGQMQQVQDALDRLMGAVTPTEGVREQLTLAFEVMDQQNSTLSERQTALSEQQANLEPLQTQIEQNANAITTRWQEWHSAENTLGERRTELKIKKQLLSIKQVRIQQLSQHLQTQSALYKQVYDLLNTSDKVRLSDKVDVAALEAMELDALNKLVSDLEKDLDKVSRFVSDQEEELNFEQEAIDELKQKIEAASEYDRLQLETELADEQDRYQMLNETLVGQRRNLLEREEVLTQHQALLRRRQGLVSEESPVNGMDLEPVMTQIDVIRKQTSEEIQTVETEIKDIQGAIETLKQTVEQLTQAQTTSREGILEAERALGAQKADLAAIEGRKELADTLLSPLQEGLANLRQRLDEASASVSQFQEASDYQLQAIAEMRQIITSFSGDASQSAATS